MLLSLKFQIASQVWSDLESFEKKIDVPKTLEDVDVASFLSKLEGTHDLAFNEDAADVGNVHMLIVKKDPRSYKYPTYSISLTTMINFYNLHLVRTGSEIRTLELFYEAFKKHGYEYESHYWGLDYWRKGISNFF